MLVAEDQEQVDKTLAVLDQAARPQRIVYLEPRGIRHRYDHELLMSWEEFLDLGREHREQHPSALDDVLAEQRPDDLATLVYTSGTTGPPKGAMLTVANVEFALKILAFEGAFTDPPPGPDDLTLSYLPLAHVAERIFSTWFNAAAATQVNFAESIETVPANLARGAADGAVRRPPHLGEAARRHRDPALRRHLVQAQDGRVLARRRRPDRPDAGRQRRLAHRRRPG